MISAIFLIVAIVLFVMQGVGIAFGKVSPGWIGLAFFAASFLV